MDKKLQKTVVNIGKQLKLARLNDGLTQVELADKVDSDTNYYAKVERGEVVPSLKLLIKLVETLKIDYCDLFPKRSKK